MTYLTDDPIDAAAMARRLLRRSDGALVVFEGVVRDHSEGKAVESIFYDAYRPMAEKEIGAIVDGVRAEWPDVAVDCLHRLGHLVVGETSIAIVCVSPHRAEAFAAYHIGGCAHCAIATEETLAEVAAGYELPLERMLADLNALLA